MSSFIYRKAYFYVVALLLFGAVEIAVSGPLKIPILGLISDGGRRQQRPVNTVVINKDDDWIDSIKRGIKILAEGTRGFITVFKQSQRLENVKKKNGSAALSFSDYQFLKRASSDKWKFLRLLATFPLSPELFFYSYIVFPMVSAGNPWAWQSLPSTYDDDQLFQSRQSILTKRRMQAVLSSLLFLKGETMEDAPAKKRAHRGAQLHAIHAALQSKASLPEAIDHLAYFFVEEKTAAASTAAVTKNKKNKNKKSDSSATLSALPGSVLKDLTRCFGVDGPPNLPLIRRLNEGEVQSQLDKVRDSDAFLREKGIAKLSSDEARVACIERFISVEKKSCRAMRSDLTEWLRLVGDSSASSSSSRSSGSSKSSTTTNVNVQNKRLALMALHAVRDLDKSEFAREYRSLLR